jgi:hypothetical protein
VNLDLANEQIGIGLPPGVGMTSGVRRGLRRQELRARRFYRAYKNLGASGVTKKLLRRAGQS